ncbi:MAG: hypothetical protein GXY16_05630 [Syntrophomonadaceae bacterium]|nr:hypothetical protein [Syntrophomonadaceae bacterium]
MIQKINRNRVFYIYIIVTLLTLIVIYAQAAQQNKGYWEDYLASEEVVKLLANNENQQAGVILKELLPRHPESYQINWYNAIYLANTGNHQEAQDYYKQALVLMPELINNNVFLWRYGENLYHLGQVELAMTYLQQCSNITTDPEIKNEVDQLLIKIQSGE